MEIKVLEIQDFIKQKGIANLSRELSIPLSTVSKWASLTRAPRYAMAGNLIKYANGALTWESIYSPFSRKVEALKNEI